MTNRFRKVLGFSPRRGARLRLRGRRYRIGPAATRTLAHLSDIYEVCHGRESPTSVSLLSARPQVRQIESLHAHGILAAVAVSTTDPTLRILAVWLRGRCGGSRGTKEIASLASDPDPQTRRTVARALRRMEGWAELRMMKAHESDPRVLAIVRGRHAPNYRERLNQFLRVTGSASTTPVPSQAPFWIAPDVKLIRNGPKPVAVLRQILARLQQLLSAKSG